MGGGDTANLGTGTLETARDDDHKTLALLNEIPGYVLMDGHNAAPGTPVENLHAVTQAVRELGTIECPSASRCQAGKRA